jgi:iron(III) transport system permease protein
MRLGVAAFILFLVLAIALPLGTLLIKSFQSSDGRFVGLANYRTYFATPLLVSSLWNSIWVSVAATAIVIPLAFGYAYALTRTRMPAQGVFSAIALLPLFAPSLLSAIAFIYIFGNQGFLKSWLFGASIYGPLGMILSQTFYCFPHALIILATALRLADARLYEAADVLGTSPWRTFRTVTLPGVKYGLISAAFVIFTLVVTDFGIAKVIGGQFNVLATDAYKQVIGQQNFEMGAVVGFVLLVPAVLAFAVDRMVQRRQVAMLTARAVPFVPPRRPLADGVATLYCIVIAALLIGVMGVAIWASFVTYWPYNLSLSFKWYSFGEFEPSGWDPYFNSLLVAATAAIFGTGIVFAGAYLVEKGQGFEILRGFAHFLAMLPMAVPGLVLGLGYVFFINKPWNPVGVLYGTIALLAINTIAHFYSTAHITATTALKQIDREFEAVSASLKVPFTTTFRRVTVPISMPAILDIAVYMFVNALTTVSAVIFLYGAHTKLAAISIVHMDEAGQTAAAAAMATMIVITALCAKVLHLVLDRIVLSRAQAWRRR